MKMTVLLEYNAADCLQKFFQYIFAYYSSYYLPAYFKKYATFYVVLLENFFIL